MNSAKRNVLFLCVHNSCRSQMAAALLARIAPERFEISSAGLEPAEQLHPLTIRVMNEIGINLHHAAPTDLRKYLGRISAHHLIIVCDTAAERCPRVFPGALERITWPFPDPAAVEGTIDEKLAAFRQVRDDIQRRLEEWCTTGR